MSYVLGLRAIKLSVHQLALNGRKVLFGKALASLLIDNLDHRTVFCSALNCCQVLALPLGMYSLDRCSLGICSLGRLGSERTPF